MQLRLIAEGSTKQERFIKRWGISFLIGEDVLFDTFGDACVFLRNVKEFEIDVNKIKHVIISHDHWDHIAGLWPVVGQNKNVTVYICAGSSPEFKEEVRSSAPHVVEVKEFMRIAEGVYSTGQILGKYAGNDIYEQSVIVSTGAGLSLITGCAHPDIVQIASSVRRQLAKVPDLVVGGLHLKEKNIGDVQAIIKILKEMGVRRLGPLHCSGKNAQEQALEQFQDLCLRLKEGQVIEL